MPRDGAIIFRDLVSKLDVFNIECDKRDRRGRYHLRRLIERYGIGAKPFDSSDEITADCLGSKRGTMTSAAPGTRKLCSVWGKIQQSIDRAGKTDNARSAERASPKWRCHEYAFGDDRWDGSSFYNTSFGACSRHRRGSAARSPHRLLCSRTGRRGRGRCCRRRDRWRSWRCTRRVGDTPVQIS